MAAYKPKSVKDVPAPDFIKAYSAHLKANDKIQLPSWVDVVKTGRFKELCPQDPDWYYTRAASIARKLYMRQGLGIGAFRTMYGGRTSRRGVAPERFVRASGGLVRHILQQLESIGFVEKQEAATAKGGRKLTGSGQRDMDLIAGRIQVTYDQF